MEANHHDHTPTSISLSSQSFAQKCNSTPVMMALEHNHHSQQQPQRQPQQLIINTDQHSFRNSELTSVVIHHQETLNSLAKPNFAASASGEDDNEDVIVIPQNGLKTHHYDKKPRGAASSASVSTIQQRRLSESDIIHVFPQKEQPQSISFLASEAASSKSEVCLSKAVQEENRRLEATTHHDEAQIDLEDSIANATAKKHKTKSLEHIRI